MKRSVFHDPAYITNGLVCHETCRGVYLVNAWGVLTSPMINGFFPRFLEGSGVLGVQVLQTWEMVDTKESTDSVLNGSQSQIVV